MGRHASSIDFTAFSLHISFMPPINGELFGTDVTSFDKDLIVSLFQFIDAAFTQE